MPVNPTDQPAEWLFRWVIWEADHSYTKAASNRHANMYIFAGLWRAWVPVPYALCSAVLPVLCALRVLVLLVGHAGGSEEEVERLGEVASRPELSSTERPLRGREYCTSWKVKR